MQSEVIDALGHNLTAVVTAPTCTESGYTMYSCTRCDYETKDSETAALGHKYAVVYQFNETGHYHSCIRCDAVTETEAHIADYPQATEAHGITCVKCNYKIAEAIEHTHTPKKSVAEVLPTCKTSGNIAYYICSCGEWFADEDCTVIIYNHSSVILQPTGHKLAYYPEQKATCTESGYTSGVLCETCLVWQSGHDVIAPKGHLFLNWFGYDNEGHWLICQTCGEPSESTQHLHGATVTDPTCTTAGYTTYTCACGHSYTGDHTVALDHAFGQWMPTNNGQHMRICAHNPSHVELLDCEYKSTVVAPDCEKVGYTKHTCMACGHSYSSDEVPALGHDFGEWKYDGKDGHVRVCKNDPSHNEYEACVNRAEVHKPTCTEGGYTLYTCETCQHTYQGNEVPAYGHSYENGTCGRCGDIKPAEVLYSYTGWISNVDGTYYEEVFCYDDFTALVKRYEVFTDGSRVLVEEKALYWSMAHKDTMIMLFMDQAYNDCYCSFDLSENDELIPHTCEKHNYKILIDRKDSTCEEGGYSTYRCYYCHVILTKPSDPLGHSYGEWKPSENGEHVQICQNDPSHVITKKCEYVHEHQDATCTADGYSKDVCIVCKNVANVEIIDALGHDYVDGVCSVCGAWKPLDENDVLNETDRSLMIKQMTNRWDTVLENYKVSAEDREAFADICKVAQTAATKAQFNSYYSDFEALIKTIEKRAEDEEFRLETLLDMTMRWSVIVENNAATEHHQKIYRELYDAVLEATTVQEIEALYAEFRELLIEIENSQNPDAPLDEQYRQEVYEQINNRYRALTQSFPKMDSELRNQLLNLKTLIKEALTYGELRGYVAEFDALEQQILADADELSGYRYSVMVEIFTRWADLQKQGLITSEYNTEYNKNILSVIRTAVTIEEIDACKVLFDDLVSRIEEGDSEEVVDEAFRQETLMNMDSLWEKAIAFGWIISDEDSRRLSELHGAVKGAMSNEEIQRCYDEFLKVIAEIESKNQTADEEYRQSILKMMKDQWVSAQLMGWIISESEQMRYNDAYNRVETASTIAQIEFALNDFETMMAQIEANNQPNVDEEYRKTMITAITRQYKVLQICFEISNEDVELYETIRNAVQTAMTRAEIYAANDAFGVLVARYLNNADGLALYRYNTLMDMYNRWTEIKMLFVVSTEQIQEYNRLYNAVTNAADESEIIGYYDEFNALVYNVMNGETKVDEAYRNEILNQMHNDWNLFREKHTVTVEQSKYFDELLMLVNTATSNEIIQISYQEFKAWMIEIENNQTPDEKVDEVYREEVYTEISNHYKALVQSFTMESDVKNRLTALRKAIPSAITQTELNGYVEEFYMLEAQVLATGDEIANYRYELLLEIFTRWEKLKAEDLVTSDYTAEYNEITSCLRYAMTVEEINEWRQRFNDLVYRMTGEEVPSVNEMFREEVLTQMSEGFYKIKMAGWIVSEEDYQYLNDLYTFVKEAKTNDDIQTFFDKFNQRMKQIESENQGGDVTADEKYRQEILSQMNMKWADIMAQNAATAEQQKHYDELCEAVMGASSNQEIENLYKDFQSLVRQIEYGGVMVDEAHRKNVLELMTKRWKTVLKNFTVSEDSALYAEQLMAKVQNAVTMEELDWAHNEFLNLVERIENSGSEIIDRKVLLDEMWNTWNTISMAYGVTAEDQAQFDNLVNLIRDAASDAEVLQYYEEFKMLVSRIENGESNDTTVDEKYREMRLQNMWDQWNKYVECYGSTEETYQNFQRWISRVEKATDNEQIDKYYWDFMDWMSNLEKDAENNKDYVENLWIDQTQFVVTVGTDVQKFIAEQLVGMNLYLQYRQSGLKVIPITYEMISSETEDLVFEKIDRYVFYVNYQENDFSCSFGITVVVQPDMSDAKMLGEYAISGELVGSSENWTLQLYDNGLAIMMMEGMPNMQQILHYTLEDKMILLDSDGIVMVMLLNEETHAAEFYRPTDELIGTYYYYDVMFQVYGVYEGAGDYITVMTQVGPDGMPLRATIYMTLDLENRTLSSRLFGGAMTFDKDGNLECLHEYAVEQRDPTCTEDGFVNEYCVKCGMGSHSVLPALGHAFDNNGVCMNCGCMVGVDTPSDYKDRYLSRMDIVREELICGYGEDIFDIYMIDLTEFDRFRSDILESVFDEDARRIYEEFLEWIMYIHHMIGQDDLIITKQDFLSQMEQEWMIANDKYGEWVNEKYLTWYEEIRDMMYASADVDAMHHLYKDDFCWLMEQVHNYANNMNGVQDIYLEQNRFELTEGHGYDLNSFIEKYVIGKTLYLWYAQTGLVEIPITWDMIRYEDTDINMPGEYWIFVCYVDENCEYQLSIHLVVQIDMSKANLIGTYDCDMSCLGENIMLRMEIYDNGYAIVTIEGDDSRDVFPCRIENGIIYLELGTGVLVMEIDGENTAHMYTPAEGTPVVGVYRYEEYVTFTVYGPYTGAGEYVAIITMNYGMPYWMTQVVYLDLENAIFESDLLGGGMMTFDEKGNLMCRHEFEINRQDPTCTEFGFENRYCMHCGVGTFEELAPLGHCYVDGICQNCGCMEEENNDQVQIDSILMQMEHEWNALWRDYGETNRAVLVQYQTQFDAYYNEVKAATSLDEAMRMFNAFNNMIKKIHSSLGEPSYKDLEQIRQELLNSMSLEWNRLMNEVGGRVIEKYWSHYDNLVDRMNWAEDVDSMYQIFNGEFQWLINEVRQQAQENQDYFITAYLEQRIFQLDEGHGYDLQTYIEKYIIGKMLYIEYSQSGIVAIPITWEMIDWDMNMDISVPGEYTLGVHYNGDNFGTWQSMRIVVWMDMSSANHLGTYTCDLLCMGEDDMMTMEIYDNGYAFIYFNGDLEDRELLPCWIENGVIYLNTGDGVYVMRIDGEGMAHMYEASENESIIGVYTYEDEIMITVYGVYEGAGQYIAKVAIVEGGEMFWVSTLVELNLENRTILCDMLDSHPISFDENGNLIPEESSEDVEEDFGSVEDKEHDFENSEDTGIAIPKDPSTPNYDGSYGEIIIIPSGGTPGFDYTYTDTIVNGNVAYLPTVGELGYSTYSFA